MISSIRGTSFIHCVGGLHEDPAILCARKVTSTSVSTTRRVELDAEPFLSTSILFQGPNIPHYAGDFGGTPDAETQAHSQAGSLVIHRRRVDHWGSMDFESIWRCAAVIRPNNKTRSHRKAAKNVGIPISYEVR
jgi:hypothetical protein